MRGTVAKRLRKAASEKVVAENIKSGLMAKWFKRKPKPTDEYGVKETEVCTLKHQGYRRVYRDMKRAYKEAR